MLDAAQRLPVYDDGCRRSVSSPDDVIVISPGLPLLSLETINIEFICVSRRKTCFRKIRVAISVFAELDPYSGLEVRISQG